MLSILNCTELKGRIGDSRHYIYFCDELEPRDEYFNGESSMPIFKPDSLNRPPESCTYSSSFFCLKHAPSKQLCEIPDSLLVHLPNLSTSCRFCDEKAVYFGYIDPRFKRYSKHVSRQIEYAQKKPNCSCYWPERSAKAAEIIDEAHSLFEHLFRTTILASLSDCDSDEDEFRNTSLSSLNSSDRIVACVARQFRFSDYYDVCADIETYAKKKLSSSEFLDVKRGLQVILNELYSMFASLYETCLKAHYSEDIEHERAFMRYFSHDVEEDEDIEFLAEEFWAASPVRALRKHKEERLALLNVNSLFVVPNPSIESGVGKACFMILKNLIHDLYQNFEFFIEAKLQMPDFEEQLLKDLIKKSYEQEIGASLHSVRELGTVDFENNLERCVFVTMCNGRHFWRKTLPTQWGAEYYSILDFISARHRSDYVISIWLAPRPLLKAIFRDDAIVDDVMQTRREIYEELQQGNDYRIKRRELAKKFKSHITEFDPKYIDFRVNRIKPPEMIESYSLG